MWHISQQKKKKKKGNISSFVLVREHKNDTLMVASGCTTKSSSVNLQTEITTMRACYAIPHIKNACNDQSSFGTRAPFMASLMWTESRARSWTHIKSVHWRGRSTCKVTAGWRGRVLRRFSVSISPPDWNAGARPRIPHRGSTWEHSVPSVRTQTDSASHGRVCVCVFPHRCK